MTVVGRRADAEVIQACPAAHLFIRLGLLDRVPLRSEHADTVSMRTHVAVIDGVTVLVEDSGVAELSGPVPDGWLIDGSTGGTFSVRVFTRGVSGLLWAMSVQPPLPVLLPVNGQFGPRDDGSCAFGFLVAECDAGVWHFGADDVEHEQDPDSRTAGQFQGLFRWDTAAAAKFRRFVMTQVANAVDDVAGSAATYGQRTGPSTRTLTDCPPWRTGGGH